MDPSVDWQNSCRNLKSRGQYILETEKWADCRFLVGTEPNQQILSGHKLILAMSSPVFERMFYGNLPDKTDPILIPDVQPDAFRAMMEYIYTDEINISSFDKACELCYVAKKYLLPHVVEQCTQFLWRDLSPKNACRAYEFAKLFEEPRLMQRCMQIITTKTKDVLTDSSFGDIELTTLLAIFDQDILNIDSELVLFNALNKYAIDRGYGGNKCKSRESSQGLDDNGDQHVDVEELPESRDVERRQQEQPPAMLNNDAGEGTSKQNNDSMSEDNDEMKLLEEMLIKEAVKKIRFLTLTPQQFAEGPAQSLLLTKEEALGILINISSTSSMYPMPEGFCTSRQKRNRSGGYEDIQTTSSKSSDGMPGFIEFNYSVPHDNFAIRTPPIALNPNPECRMGYGNYCGHNPESEGVNITMEARKFYCVRTIRQQIDYRNTSVTDCSLTFHVDKNILITGVQVPTQVLCGEMMSSEGFTERYSEILYAHLLDAQGSRLTYTHCTSRVRYDSLLEISFDRPVFIHRQKMYKIGVVFNKVGWYPMYTVHPEVTCDDVTFMFNVGSPHESLRDGLIRAIVFLHPFAPSSPHSYPIIDM